MDLKNFNVLLVDDESDNLDAFRFNFRKSFSIITAGSGKEALEILEKQEIAVIVTDQRMPEMTGLDLLTKVRDLAPDTIGCILTAYTEVDVLIEAINLGKIYRYIAKPWDSHEMRGILAQTIERYALVKENRKLQEQLTQYTGYLNQELHGAFDFGNIIGDSEPLKQVLEKVEQVAGTDSTVMLRGETGTGKELVAHAVHINSQRESGPFVRVNCASLAQGILESELFGHEKGAFTGAMSQRQGRFELANGGTLFLDEVGDIPMDVQIKLLRTLQERELERVGGSETIKVDVRVISATHRNLEKMIEEGAFREDLYYRLNVFPIALPPLRDRPSDITALAEHFSSKFNRGKPSKCTPAALQKLADYHWPGNVRELENVIERALILSPDKNVIDVPQLDFGPRGQQQPPDKVAVSSEDTASREQSLVTKLRTTEKQEIISAVDEANGNIAKAARSLGINRSTLYYRMKKHGLDHLLPTKIRVSH